MRCTYPVYTIETNEFENFSSFRNGFHFVSFGENASNAVNIGVKQSNKRTSVFFQRTFAIADTKTELVLSVILHSFNGFPRKSSILRYSGQPSSISYQPDWFQSIGISRGEFHFHWSGLADVDNRRNHRRFVQWSL